MAQQKGNWLGSVRMQVWFLASLSGLRIWHCHELWCRLEMWLISGMAVAVASCCSSNYIPSLGTSICHSCGPNKQTNKQTKMHNTISLKYFQWTRKFCTTWPHVILEFLIPLTALLPQDSISCPVPFSVYSSHIYILSKYYGSPFLRGFCLGLFPLERKQKMITVGLWGETA